MLMLKWLKGFLKGFLMGAVEILIFFGILGPLMLAMALDSMKWLWLYCLSIPLLIGFGNMVDEMNKKEEDNDLW